MKKPPVIFHGWLIVATGIVIFIVGYGARFSFSVIFPSLLEEFQWPRDLTAAMLSVHMLVYGLVAPVAGHLVDTIGPRKTMGFGTMLLVLGLLLSGRGSEPWHFYLGFGVLSGAGLCLAGSVSLTTVLKNWFEKKRGMALSFFNLGLGGAFVSYPVIAFLINSVGWRSTFLIEAIFVAGLMLPPIIFIVRYHPQEKGLILDGILDAGKGSPDTVEEGLRIMDHVWAAMNWTLPKAAGTSRFWLLCLSSFSVWGITQLLMVAHHVAFAVDLGYSNMYASSVLSLHGILFACGSLAGLVSDRIGRELTMAIGTISGISGIFVLTLIEDTSQPWMLYYYAMALGFGLGVTAPTIPAAATDIFQGPRVGAILGFVWLSFAMGGFVGPWLGGWIFELTNSYLIAFIVAIIFFAVGCAALWGAAPRKVRLVPGWSRLG